MKVNIGKYPMKADVERKVSVLIDPWDVWSLDSTLALIIHPALIKLKEVKQGAPSVDDADVAYELSSVNAQTPKNEWDVDSNWFKRWDYILDCMIFSFGEIAGGRQGEDAFSKELPLTEDSDVMAKSIGYELEVDWDGLKAHQAKVQLGLTLFGKYYQNLWD